MARQLGLEEVTVDRITVPKRLRAVDQDWVDLYAVSIAENGLQQPIQVRRTAFGWELIAGAHRLAAVRQIALPSIAASVWEATPDEARLMEIDENLHRRELSPFDRAKSLAERQAVWLRLHPETARGKAGAAKRHHATDNLSFASSAAEKVGLSERSIRRAIALWNALSPSVREAIEGTDLADDGGFLAKLAKLPAAKQRAMVDLRRQGHRPLPKEDTVEAQLARLTTAWDKAGPQARDQFRTRIGGGR